MNRSILLNVDWVVWLRLQPMPGFACQAGVLESNACIALHKGDHIERALHEGDHSELAKIQAC
jgi:hypothetical protein